MYKAAHPVKHPPCSLINQISLTPLNNEKKKLMKIKTAMGRWWFFLITFTNDQN